MARSYQKGRPNNKVKKGDKITRFRVNLSPGVRKEGIPEVDVGDFFLGYDAVLESVEEGYKLPIGRTAVCMECDGEIIQECVVGTPDGMGCEATLVCKCSVWTCPASPHSGVAYVQHNLKCVGKLSKEEKVRRALQAYGIKE